MSWSECLPDGPIGKVFGKCLFNVVLFSAGLTVSGCWVQNSTNGLLCWHGVSLEGVKLAFPVSLYTIIVDGLMGHGNIKSECLEGCSDPIWIQ